MRNKMKKLILILLLLTPITNKYMLKIGSITAPAIYVFSDGQKCIKVTQEEYNKFQIGEEFNFENREQINCK